jgi:phospholipid-binding lipoprotein MlaA
MNRLSGLGGLSGLSSSTRHLVLWAALAFSAALSGCMTTPSTATSTANTTSGPGITPKENIASNPADPWENWNRKVYAFNDAVDEAVLKPVAKAYKAVVPSLVRAGVSNVLGNIGDVWSAANHLLQGKLQTGLEMGMRVLTNTFFGLGGLLDPATEMGLTRRSEDFGQTLGRWGVGSGPYVVLPLLGPSTVRDAAAIIVDRQAAASNLAPTQNGSLAITGLSIVDLRANLLDTTRMLDAVALDRYSFVRDGWLQRRRDALYDGAPPLDPADADPGDSAPAPAAPSKPGAAPAPAPAPAKPAAVTPATPAKPASAPSR